MSTNNSVMKSLRLLRMCSRHHGILRRNICSTTRRDLDEKETKIPLVAQPISADVNHEGFLRTHVSQSRLQDGRSVSTVDEVTETDVNNKNSEKLADSEKVNTNQQIDAVPRFDVRHVEPSTIQQVYYFDSLQLAKALQSKGFMRTQAEGLVECLVDLVNSTLDHQSRHMISKSQQEVAIQHLVAEIALVKKDMVILQKSEFNTLRNETEKQSFEIRQIRDSVRDEIGKLKGQMTLDINLERSRAVEAHAGNQKYLTVLNQKIETEVANLRTKYEIYRNDVFKYAGGTVLTCAGLCMTILRVWS